MYVRISKDRTGAGMGVARQEKDCRALAKQLGWQVAEVYTDNDLSAYSGKPRPAYQRMLADLETGTIDAVVVWHTDRLHRSPKELETFVELVERMKVATQTVKAGELDLASPSGRMVARTLGAMARYESEHKAERQSRKAQELAEAGLPTGGGRPFGYEPGGLVVRESEASVIREATARVIAGDSLRSLMRDFNERGITTTRGNKWAYTNLRELLLRPRNAGLSVYRGEVIGKAQWPALVDEDDFRTVTRILTNPERRTTTTRARKHLLSGMAKCGKCGAGMKPGTVKFRNGARHVVYRCCVSRGTERLERFVTRVTLLLLVNKSVRMALMAASNVDTAPLQAERDQIAARLDDAALAFADGDITAAQLKAITSRSRERLDALDAELSSGLSGTALGSLLTVPDLLAAWEALSLERKRSAIDSLMTVTVLPVGRRGRGPQPVADGVQIELRTNAASADDLTAALLGERLTDEQERAIVRAFAA